MNNKFIELRDKEFLGVAQPGSASRREAGGSLVEVREKENSGCSAAR